MKTIITLGIGFWLGRQIYINYDKKESRQKEARLKKRLLDFLEVNNFSKTESKKQAKKILES
ncbi:hypothetical protein [Flavivirga rizhaonensis]|uniref:Uncharacterized protein n=1 Tax=Flavivirga rizhaonensis TaxID=2559571 RepID=A0A4S1DZE8_9FLAO|nr:hypothetical protein [Flavivirga rizhaonensis]TGV03636.1 hypothetical protein EM932_06315 [Flavivirga rizhaonensis]